MLIPAPILLFRYIRSSKLSLTPLQRQSCLSGTGLAAGAAVRLEAGLAAGLEAGVEAFYGGGGGGGKLLRSLLGCYSFWGNGELGGGIVLSYSLWYSSGTSLSGIFVRVGVFK